MPLFLLSACLGLAFPPGLIYRQKQRSVAQPGSALDWGSRGRGFESRRSDHFGLFRFLVPCYCSLSDRLFFAAEILPSG